MHALPEAFHGYNPRPARKAGKGSGFSVTVQRHVKQGPAFFQVIGRYGWRFSGGATTDMALESRGQFLC